MLMVLKFRELAKSSIGAVVLPMIRTKAVLEKSRMICVNCLAQLPVNVGGAELFL
jgi:hypothetical protein